MKKLQVLFTALASLTLGGQLRAAVEFFDHSSFLNVTSSLTVIDFDSLATGNDVLVGDEFTAQGLTIAQRDGGPINVLNPSSQNSFSYGTNANSSPNVISSVLGVFFNDNNGTDNFDFTFSAAITAAGLWIGNVGGAGPTTVSFLDPNMSVIADETFGPTPVHPQFIFGASGVVYDNRIFYGIISSAPVQRIRVSQSGGGEGITLDDVQFGVYELTSDFDLNNRVDAFDFLAWQRNPSLGNLADWEASYGFPLTANSASVPEPYASVLVLIGLFLTICRR